MKTSPSTDERAHTLTGTSFSSSLVSPPFFFQLLFFPAAFMLVTAILNEETKQLFYLFFV